MEKRLLKREEDAGANRRKDDNAESIKKRFRTYVSSTRPIIDMYTTMGKTFKIDAEQLPEMVFASVKPVIESLDTKMTPKAVSRLTVHYRVSDRKKLQDYFDVHAARLRGDGLKRFGGKMTASRRVLRSHRTDF